MGKISGHHGAVGLSFLACRVLQFICLVVAMALTARFIATMVDDIQQPPPPLIGALTVICFAIVYVIATVILYWDHQLPLLPGAGLDALFFIVLLVVSIVIGKPLSYISCKALGNGVKGYDLINHVGNSLNQASAVAETAASWTPEEVAPATPTIVEQATATAVQAVATVAATFSPGGTQQVWGSDGQLYTITGPSRFAKRGDTTDAIMKVVNYEDWVASGSENSCMMMKAVWGFGICLTVMFFFSAAMMVFLWRRDRAAPISRAKSVDDA